jgi:hypothetical protein
MEEQKSEKIEQTEFKENFSDFEDKIVCTIATLSGRVMTGVPCKKKLWNGQTPSEKEFTLLCQYPTIIPFDMVRFVFVDEKAILKYAHERRQEWRCITTDSNGLINSLPPDEFRAECERHLDEEIFVLKQNLQKFLQR